MRLIMKWTVFWESRILLVTKWAVFWLLEYRSFSDEWYSLPETDPNHSKQTEVIENTPIVCHLFLGNELTRVVSQMQSKCTSPVSTNNPQTNLRKQLSGDNTEAEQVRTLGSRLQRVKICKKTVRCNAFSF